MGPITKKLYETLTGIQMGRIEAPEGWISTKLSNDNKESADVAVGGLIY